MSLLNNNFLTFGGESVTGRVPTQRPTIFAWLMA